MHTKITRGFVSISSFRLRKCNTVKTGTAGTRVYTLFSTHKQPEKSAKCSISTDYCVNTKATAQAHDAMDSEWTTECNATFQTAGLSAGGASEGGHSFATCAAAVAQRLRLISMPTCSGFGLAG